MRTFWTSTSYLHGQRITASPRRYIFASRDRIDEVADRQRAVRDQRYKYIRSWAPDVAGGHKLNYRDNLAMVRTWRSLYTAGKLTPVQARWFKPAGEAQLYDTFLDPHETQNLIADPAYAAITKRLTQALGAFQTRVGDTSELPETEMRDSYLQQGAVPVTGAPTFTRRGNTIVLESADHASIGYRAAGKDTWQLYVSPLPTTEVTLEARAVRYGWQPSQIVTLQPK